VYNLIIYWLLNSTAPGSIFHLNTAFSLVDGTLYAWNGKLHVAGIFCDLAKAFDYVNHEISIAKMEYYELHE
jgi:hypothetical protein